MKTFVKAVGFATLLVSLSLCAPGAQARNVKYILPTQDVIEKGKTSGQLDSNIGFFFADQEHPAVETMLTKDAVSNRKNRERGDSEGEMCKDAFLLALAHLQDAARNQGGNAVVNIESYYKKNVFRSKDMFECHAGHSGATVTLKGDIVKLKK